MTKLPRQTERIAESSALTQWKIFCIIYHFYCRWVIVKFKQGSKDFTMIFIDSTYLAASSDTLAPTLPTLTPVHHYLHL